MRVFLSSLKGTTLAIVAFSVLYLLMYMPRTAAAFSVTIAGLLMMLMYVVVPIFVISLLVNIFAKPTTPGIGTPRSRNFSPGAVALIYAAVAGAGALIMGAMFQIAVIFAAAGAIVGYFVGRSNGKPRAAKPQASV